MASVCASVLNPVCKNVIVGASLRCRAAREALSIGRWLAHGLYKLFLAPPACPRARSFSGGKGLGAVRARAGCAADGAAVDVMVCCEYK